MEKGKKATAREKEGGKSGPFVHASSSELCFLARPKHP